MEEPLEPCCCSMRKAYRYRRKKGARRPLAARPTGRRPRPAPGPDAPRGSRRKREAAAPGEAGARGPGREGGTGPRQGRGRGPTGPRCRRPLLTLGCFLAWLTITRNMAAAGAGEAKRSSRSLPGSAVRPPRPAAEAQCHPRPPARQVPAAAARM